MVGREGGPEGKEGGVALLGEGEADPVLKGLLETESGGVAVSGGGPVASGGGPVESGGGPVESWGGPTLRLAGGLGFDIPIPTPIPVDLLRLFFPRPPRVLEEGFEGKLSRSFGAREEGIAGEKVELEEEEEEEVEVEVITWFAGNSPPLFPQIPRR